MTRNSNKRAEGDGAQSPPRVTEDGSPSSNSRAVDAGETIRNIFFKEIGQEGEPAVEPDASDPATMDATDPVAPAASPGDRGRIQTLRAPTDALPDLVRALKERVGEVGEFCDQAYLFQAEYESGETVLMVCFSGADPEDRTYVEGAVTDALIASRNAGHTLGVVYLESGQRALQRISRLGLDLLS